MEKYSKEVDEFLKKEVLPKLGFEDYNEDNIDDIYEYLFGVEGDFASLEERGKKLTEKEKVLFEKASNAVTEITSREDW